MEKKRKLCVEGAQLKECAEKETRGDDIGWRKGVYGGMFGMGKPPADAMRKEYNRHINVCIQCRDAMKEEGKEV